MDVSRAVFRNANLQGVNLSEAVLEEAEFEGALYNAASIWPDGFDPSSRGAIQL